MPEMDAAKFREQCLWLLDHAEGIIVTKHGKPVAKVIPIEGSCADLLGSLKGKLKLRGDLLSTRLRWDAES